MTTKDFKSFNNSIEKIINTYGGIEIENRFGTSFKTFSIETKFGSLRISLETEKPTSNLYTVFTRFEEIKRVNVKELEIFTLNRNSGKCNFHYFNPTDITNYFSLLLDIIYS